MTKKETDEQAKIQSIKETKIHQKNILKINKTNFHTKKLTDNNKKEL